MELRKSVCDNRDQCVRDTLASLGLDTMRPGERESVLRQTGFLPLVLLDGMVKPCSCGDSVIYGSGAPVQPFGEQAGAPSAARPIEVVELPDEIPLAAEEQVAKRLT